MRIIRHPLNQTPYPKIDSTDSSYIIELFNAFVQGGPRYFLLLTIRNLKNMRHKIRKRLMMIVREKLSYSYHLGGGGEEQRDSSGFFWPTKVFIGGVS